MTWITRSTKLGIFRAPLHRLDRAAGSAGDRGSFFTPSESTSALWTRTESRHDTTGKLEP